jgi:hypothetical protein
MKPLRSLIAELPESDLIAILEAARIALADGEVAWGISERMDISDARLSELQDQLQKLLT